MKHSTSILYKFSWLGFFAIVLFLSLNRHSRTGRFNYHSEIWADKAGYYFYLPATLKYHFDPALFPDSIDAKTGHGFKLDLQNNKITSKYTCGVALMQLPFFICADLLAKPLGYADDGFSLIYYKSINVAAVFYLLLGLYFLLKRLRKYFPDSNPPLVLISVFLASNLYYYGIDETGMSHIYSFSLFSILLYLLQKSEYLIHADSKHLFLLGLVSGLIVLIRPINVIFLSSFLFLDLQNKGELIQRLKLITQPKSFLILIAGTVLVLLPQFIYWHYSSGSALIYSYGEEGFNWSKPKLLQVWFSPYNGLFLYSPFYLLLIGLSFYLTIKKHPNGIFIFLLFLLLSYVISCWWDPGFGCSFGARSYVEYLPLFSLPLAYYFQKVKRMNKTKRLLFYTLLLILMVYNLKMTYSYDGCFYGEKNWDWNTFYQHFSAPTK